MTRKNKQHFLLLTVLSVGHLLFSTTSYPFLFAYFNSHDYAALFATAMAVLRVLFCSGSLFGAIQHSKNTRHLLGFISHYFSLI